MLIALMSSWVYKITVLIWVHAVQAQSSIRLYFNEETMQYTLFTTGDFKLQNRRGKNLAKGQKLREKNN